MSRIGRKPIVIPAGVTVTVDEAAHSVTVKGPKGSLNSNYHPLMTVKVEGNEVLVTRPNDEPQALTTFFQQAVQLDSSHLCQ